jgi:hypothetical protein
MKPLRQQIAEAIVHANLVSHSNAFPIAVVVLRTIGNGAIKTLQEENARMRAGLEQLQDHKIVEQEHIIQGALGLPVDND